MELKIQDLRFGNYYIYDDDITKFTFQTIKDMEFEDGYIGEPLPITKELLLKLGFKDNNLQMKGYNWFEIKTDSEYSLLISVSKIDFPATLHSSFNGEWCIVFSDIPTEILAGGFGRGLKYYNWIHEIQNFYFSLTGKELTFPVDEIRDLKINQILKEFPSLF
jgi:hypothetical protein